MVKCDRCPFKFLGEGYFDGYKCLLTTKELSYQNGYYCSALKDCPLKRIELKDGTVFEPEEIDGSN